MRLATVATDSGTRVALVLEDELALFPADLQMRDLITSGLEQTRRLAEDVDANGPRLPLSQARLLAPLAPTSVRDFVTFAEHVEGVRRSVDGASGVPQAWYAAPTFYFTNPHTIVGPDAEIATPAGCHALDFELEVAVVVGRDGTDLTVDEAAGPSSDTACSTTGRPATSSRRR